MRLAAIPWMLACRWPAATPVDHVYPVLEVSSTALDFGTVDIGHSVDQTLIISNVGGSSIEDGMTMGVSSVTLLNGASENVSVSFDVADITCAVGVNTDHSQERAREDADTGCGENYYPPVDTSAHVDTGPDSGVIRVDTDSGPFTLDPGCSIPVTVMFTPTTAGEVQEALSIETDAAPDPWQCEPGRSMHAKLPPTAEEDAEFLGRRHQDGVHLRKVVYLKGSGRSVSAAAPAPLRVVGAIVAASQYNCESGDVITLDTRIAGAGASEATFEGPGEEHGPGHFLWACPWLSGTGGKAYLLTFCATAPSGESVYAYTKVGVFPRGSGLYAPYTAGILPK